MKYSLKTLWKNLKILSKYNLEDIEYNLEKKYMTIYHMKMMSIKMICC